MSENINEQIEKRLCADEDIFSDAFVNLSEIIAGNDLSDFFSPRTSASRQNAIIAILDFYGFKTMPDVPDTITDPLDSLDYITRPLGIMYRGVSLKDQWYKNATGAFIGMLQDDSVVALIPKAHGYIMVHSLTGEKTRITKKNASQIKTNAICFYPPLPQKKLSVWDLLKHVFKSLMVSDFIKIILCTLAITLVSMITPRVTQYIYSNVVLQPYIQPLIAVLFLLIAVEISKFLLDMSKTISLSSISIKLDASVNSALMMRVLNMPTGFFKDIPSGELYSRINSASSLCSTILNVLLSGVLTVIMSFIYLFQIFRFTPTLVIPSLIFILMSLVYSVIVVIVQSKITGKKLETRAAESGFLYSTIAGMQKIKLSGSERRIFARWADVYKKNAEYSYNPPVIIKYYSTITLAITLISSGLLYLFALNGNVEPAQYMAFISAYGLLSGAFTSLISSMMSFSVVPAIMKLIKPILESIPESQSKQRSVSKLTGKIEISGVSFQYAENMPKIIDNLSLKINPGEYVAIVGKSGCGKTTLLRLLLGFERPQKGSISYDNLDIKSIEPKSLRSHIGTVMQNTGLFTGTLRSNITIASPFATDDDVWRACEMAGIAEDIKKLPMGLNTLVTDNISGISGGQKQRIIIARAIASAPDILLFDEATSALDNYTQKIVVESLAKLQCTRIVVAHRLSTVRECDRIIMLEEGKIIEEGTYDELIAKNGKFKELVARQMVQANK